MVKQSAWHILPFWQRDARRERLGTPRGRCKADARRGELRKRVLVIAISPGREAVTSCAVPGFVGVR
jgi:hypothetical protein